jgi:hypothetical protein
MNMKERALMGAISPAMGIINALAPVLNTVQPTNHVSQFIEDISTTLFPEESNSDIRSMITKIIVVQTNENPEQTLHKLLCFYEAFRVFYGKTIYTSDTTVSE